MSLRAWPQIANSWKEGPQQGLGPSAELALGGLRACPLHSPSYTPVTLSSTPALSLSCLGESRDPGKSLWEKRETVVPPAPPVLRSEGRRRRVLLRAKRKTKTRKPPTFSGVWRGGFDSRVVEGGEHGGAEERDQKTRPREEEGGRGWQPGFWGKGWEA